MTSVFLENLSLLRRFDSEKADILAKIPLIEIPPKREHADSFQAVSSIDNLITLFVYRLGFYGEEYLSIRGWLHQNHDRTVVFLVDDFTAARAFMESPVATQMLKDSQVIFKLFKWPDEQEWPQFRQELAWFYKIVLSNKYVFVPKFSATPDEVARVPILYKKFQESIDWWIRGYRVDVKNRSKFIHSYYSNLLELLNSKSVYGMAGAFKNVPAIICGAGPSINQHLGRLRSLNDRAIIFASGSGLNVLSRNGVIPHFACGFDPTPTQLSRVSTNFAFQVPFFFTINFSNEALRFIQGEKIAIREGINPYINDWFDEQLGLPIRPQISMGATTSNHCFDIAYFLGCNPIILTGIDLCYENNDVRYAAGVTAHPAEDRKHHAEIKSKKTGLCKAVGLHGQEVTTSVHWFLEADCFMASHEAHPEITVWNATEGGMPIKGIPNTTLQEIIERDLTETYDFDARIHTLLQHNGMDFLTKDKLIPPLKQWIESLLACKEVLISHHKKKQKEMKELHSFVDGTPTSAFSSELDNLLADNIAYSYCLKLITNIFEELNEKYYFRVTHFPESYPARTKKEVQLFLEIKCCMYLLVCLNTHLTRAQEVLKEIPTYPMLPRSTSNVQKEVLVENEPSKTLGEHLRRFYYATGELYAIKRFKDTLLHGKQEYFFTDGQTRTLINYTEGLLDGEVKLFYPCGLEKRVLHFSQGKLHGVEKLWDEKGLLIKEAEFCNNNPTGIARSWHSNGVLAREIIYNTHGFDSTATEWDKNGKPL